MTPYGGLLTTQPTVDGSTRSDAVRRSALICPATPAFAALASVAATAPSSRSNASSGGQRSMTSLSAPFTRRSQPAGSNVGHCMNWNVRRRPGAMRRALMAASMTMVPDPQNGSTSALRTSHSDAVMSAAASVSRMGALPGRPAVAALVQGGPGGVDADRDDVALHAHLHLLVALAATDLLGHALGDGARCGTASTCRRSTPTLLHRCSGPPLRGNHAGQSMRDRDRWPTCRTRRP